MSDYPPTPSYGASYGAQDQTNPPYVPPTFPNQYVQPDVGHALQGNMASNYDAFGYNRAIPPFSATAVASGVPPLPIYQGWNQSSVPLPPYAPHQASVQYSSYSGTNQHNAQYYPPVNQQNYHQNSHVTKGFEQNDLSEGEFEDGVAATNTPPVGYGNSYNGNDGTGYVDTAQRAVFNGSQNYSPQQSSYPVNSYNYPTRDSSQNRRQASASYSPYVSPSGGDPEEQSNTARSYNAYTSMSSQPTNGAPPKSYNWAKANNIPSTTQPQYHANKSQTENAAPKAVSSVPASASVPTPGTSIVEASRKKAEGAVLSLWPHNVRYDEYIEQGIESDIVGRIFDDLKISKGPSKSVNSTSKTSELAAQTFAVTATAKDSGTSGSKVGGLLPLATNLPQPIVSNGLNSQTSTSPSTSLAVQPPAKSAEMTEKQRTLQSKMDALRKSREERAQKAAAKITPKSEKVQEPVQEPQGAPKSNLTERVDTMALAAEVSSSKSSTQSLNSLSKSPSIPKSQLPISNASTSSYSPLQSIPLQPPPAIPGLFLAGAGSPAPIASSPSMVRTTEQPPQHRKRPVAADFDDPVPVRPPFKRPFGHSRNDTPLVIDVSEDEEESEDEDVAMEIESQTEDSPRQPSKNVFEQKSAAPPPQSFLPSRKPFTPPPVSSATNTPPLSQSASKSSLGRPAALQSEIEELKRKIAEAEARKKAKARQTPSGTRTPRASDSNGSEAKESAHLNVAPANSVGSSAQMQQLAELAEKKASLDQHQAVEDEKAAEAEKVAETRKRDAKQSKLLREQILSEKAAIEQKEKQMQAEREQLRARMAELDVASANTLVEKQRLEEQERQLREEIEAQAQAEKAKGDAAAKEDTAMSNGVEDTSNMDVTHAKSPLVETQQPSPSPAQQQQMLPLEPEEQVTTPKATDVSTDIREASLPRGPSDGGSLNSSQEPGEVSEEAHSNGIVSADHALEAALQEAVRAEADLHARESEDIEMSYAPDPNQLAPDSTSIPIQESRLSPEYSPNLHRDEPPVVDRESDDYEPPEATPPSDEQPIIESPPFSPAPPEHLSEQTEDEASDINEMQGISKNTELGVEEILPTSNGSAPVEPAEQTDQTQRFTPYESPLKQFRNYRFHPEFSNTINGGLRSNTYSHKINPGIEFCRYELAGGICNDATCEFQHFRDIGLPDDAVLTALGSPDEFTGEQRDRFCAGLKEVLLDLRVRKIRDFNIIASEIVAHRAKFLGDKSKVLALEGVSI